jgi:hypothetical protein
MSTGRSLELFQKKTVEDEILESNLGKSRKFRSRNKSSSEELKLEKTIRIRVSDILYFVSS